MKSDTPLDYAVFQLSPRRSRCELFVSSDGNTEKLASGLVKPFVTHLKVAEEQVALAVQSIKLEVEKCKNAETWFTKGTLERFVRFVSTPEVLELVNTFDAEMSQLEAARRIYSQGVGDQILGTMGADGTGATAAADATKKELLRAIDVRLLAVRQDLTTACARASAAGFNPDTVLELQLFADRFGAHRLNEACNKFITLCQRRPDLINNNNNNPWKGGVDDRAVRSSSGSDMSIDDPTEEHSGSHHHQQQQQQQNRQLTGQEADAAGQSKSSTRQQQPKSSVTFPIRRGLRESSSERDDGKESDGTVEKEEKVTESETPSFQTSQPARRLSVQDRINLFENKQKENSGGAGAGAGGSGSGSGSASASASGGKPVVGKSGELRRLSSDVSSAPAAVEKAVLRRWSGASDMSIDLSIEKKEIESPLCTPSSSTVPLTKSGIFSSVSDDKDRKGLNELKIVPSRGGDIGLKDQVDSQTRAVVGSGRDLEIGSKVGTNWKDQIGGGTQARSFSGRAEGVDLKDQTTSQTQFKSFPGRAEQFGLEDQADSEPQFRALSADRAAPQTHFGASASKEVEFRSDGEAYQVSLPNRVEDVRQRDQPVTQSRFRGSLRTTVVDVASNSNDSLASQIHSQSLSGQLEGGTGLRIREASLARTESDPLALLPQLRSFGGVVEEAGKKDSALSEKQPGSFATKAEDSGLSRMKLQKQVFAPEQIRKSQGRRDESSYVYGNSNPVFPGKKVSESQETFGSISTAPVEQVQRVRQSKGNQELNDELKMKANELEKLFAEHKLRVPGDQSNSTRRSKPADTQMERAASSVYRKTEAEIAPVQVTVKNAVTEPTGSSSSMAKFDVSSLTNMVDIQDYGDTLKQNFSELGFSDDSRGKFYDRYMQKRDAKLREEWGSKRAEKEAKLKAMQDSLERSRDEMKAKFAGSADRQNSVLSARRRAEKLRSFNFRTPMKREQQPIDSVQSEEDEDLSEFPELKPYGQDRSFIEASIGDGASRSTQPKKVLPNRNLSSSTPRTLATPVPRSSVKASNSSSGRRRMQSENPLAQSVPNFSDLRKENTKPSSGVSKTTTRLRLRNYARSKSTNEEIPLAKEEKPRRSQSLRKSSANPVEFKDLSPLNSDGIVLTPLKFDKEQSEHSLHDKVSKNMESKPFLRKGNGIGPGAGAGIAKLKASMVPEALKNEEESDELAFEPADSVDMVKEEEEEEFETMMPEDCANMDNGKSTLSQESDKSGNSGSENGDALRSPSQVDPASVAELPVAVPSTFHTIGSTQDSPGESPVSWNSRMHHSFSYPHEISDIDASVDSPMGSPASWNSHSLAQTEADAARMRKKWGSAQKPILVANSSHNQSRKDVTKGFKRLLKFGRKSRGTESLVDWISATTSEGDDDTEDVRDPANRSSEDLRKSRMGFSQGHPSDDGFNESELFNAQVQILHSSIPTPPANFKLREDHLSESSLKAPRSFFSLSSFRSKGNDSKPR